MQKFSEKASAIRDDHKRMNYDPGLAAMLLLLFAATLLQEFFTNAGRTIIQ